MTTLETVPRSTTSREQVGRVARLLTGAETKGQVREALGFWMFVSPWILGLILFFGGPIITSLILSFYDYTLVKPPVFVGLDNFRMAFTQDILFWPSLARTFTWTILYVPLVVTGSLLLSILLNQKLHATNVFRTLFFLPHLTPAVALGVLWKWILHPRIGPVNFALTGLGMANPPGWLTSEQWALPGLVIMGLWGGVGGNRMLIFLAGLQGVPTELYEASDIDGAGPWAKFWNITVPLISPVVFFNMLLAIIGALKVFSTAFVATEGGPNYATWFLALHIYNQAFRYFRMGYGSTLAWVLAILLVIFTLVQMQLSNRWVYYAAE